MSVEKITYNPCMGGGCHETCLLQTHSVDGKVIRTQKVKIPGTDKYISGICQKGIEYAKFPYLEHPDKLHYPMKRTGERGSGEFERIGWDQALDEIGQKLSEIRDECGPNAVLVDTFGSSYPDAGHCMVTHLTSRWINAFGATILPYIPADAGVVHACMMQFGSVFFGPFAYDTHNLQYADYIIFWGNNCFGQNRAGHTTKFIMDAKENGCKLVDVGPIFDTTAALSDEFLPVKTATDYYLAISMAHVLFRDGLIDEEFLAGHTTAPLLVRDDNGQLLRISEILDGGSETDFVVWDEQGGEPVPVSPSSQTSDTVKVMLYGHVKIKGIACTPVLELLKNLVNEWSPERQEAITDIPAATVERVITEFVKAENGVLYLYEGMRYKNAGPACRAITMLPVLAGKIGKVKAGGLAVVGLPYAGAALNDGPIMVPGNPAEFQSKFAYSITEMLEQGFPYKALLNICANPVASWPNLQMWTEKIFPKLDLIVSYEVRMSDTARYADYILPDTNTLEREEITVKENYLIYCEPAYDAPEARGGVEFFTELANRTGVGEFFDKTRDEWLELRLQTADPAITTLEPPVTLERLKNEKIIKLNAPEEAGITFENLSFATPSGRIELYTEDMYSVGQALPNYFDPYIYETCNEGYPFQLLVGRHRVLVQSQFGEFPLLRKLSSGKPFARMNAQDAIKLGLHEGETVEVYNKNGSLRVPLQVTNAYPPGVVYVPYAFSAKWWEGDPPQALMEEMGGPVHFSEYNKTYIDGCKKHAIYPETFDMEHRLGLASETYWDNVCNIRKVEEVQ